MPDILDQFAQEQGLSPGSEPEPTPPVEAEQPPPPPEPMGPPEPDVLDQFAAEQADDRQYRIQRVGSMRRALGSPDKKAAVLAISRQTGADPAFVEHEFDFWKSRSEAAQSDEDFYVQNPHIVELALDNPWLGEVITKDKPLNTLQAILRGFRHTVGFTYLDDLERAQKGAPQFYGEDSSLLRTFDPAQYIPGELEGVSPKVEKQSLVKTPLAQATGLERGGIYLDAAKRSFEPIELGWLTMKYAAQRFANVDTYETEKQAIALRNRAMEPDYQAGPIEQIGLDAAQFLGSHAISLGTTLLGVGVAGKVLGLGAKAASGVGGGLGFATSFVMESSSFWDMKAQVDDQGRPVDDDTALAAALGYAAVSAGIETGFNVSKWVPFFKSAGKEASKQAVKEFLQELAKDPVRSSLLRAGLRNWAKTAAEEGLEEATQGLAEDVFGWFSRSRSAGLQDGGSFSPQKTDVVGALGEAIDTWATATVGSFVMAGAPAAKRAYTMDREAQRSIVAARQLASITGAIPDSPTAKAAPAAFARVVERETEESGVKVDAAYIDPQGLVTLAQEQHLDPAALLEEAIGPEASKAFQEALAAGQKMRVPLAEYVDKWHKAGLADALLADTTTRANGVPTPRERLKREKDFEKEVEAELKLMDSEDDAPTETEKLFTQIADELVKATPGRTKADAKTQTAVWRAIVRTEAARNGMDREDVAKILAVKVAAAPKLKGNPRVQSLVQGHLTEQALRNDSPEFRAWFKDSVVVDENGAPLVVYHGTAATQIDAFRTDPTEGETKFADELALDNPDGPNSAASWMGSWFSNNASLAARYGDNIYPVYLNIKNPKRYTRAQFAAEFEMSWDDAVAMFDAQQDRLDSYALAETISQGLAHVEDLQKQGFDGIAVEHDDGTVDYAVFKPEQVKSIFNRGNWDARKPAILDQDAQALLDRVVAALAEENPSPNAEVVPSPLARFEQLERDLEFDEDGKITKASLKGSGFDEYLASVRKWMEENRYTEDEIKKHLSALKGQLKIFKALGARDLTLLPGTTEEAQRDNKWGPIRKNVDPIYKISFDASAMCVKRLEASATQAYVQEKLGRPLTASERIALVAFFKEAGKTAPCLYCYVESPRAKAGDFVARALDVVTGKKNLRKGAKGDEKRLAKAARKHFERMRLKPEDLNPNYILDPETARTAEAQRELVKHAPIYDYLAQQGLYAKANQPKLYAEYRGQIRAVKQKTLDELNKYAGFRFFSTSDFQAEHVIDLIQAFQDLSLRKARAHAYTKVADFVRIFGKTGMKIQMSLFAKEVDGKFVADTWQGMDWEEAKAFRKQFKNVGTVFVATSDAQVEWALDQDFIDYIIPFHYSGLEKKYYEQLGWEDFTATQNEKRVKGLVREAGPKKFEVVFYGEVIGTFASKSAAEAARRKEAKKIIGAYFERRRKGGERIPEVSVEKNEETGLWEASLDGETLLDGEGEVRSFKTEAAAEAAGTKAAAGGVKKIRMWELGAHEGVSNEEMSRRYLKLARERGLEPVFAKFAGHRNYSKLKKDYSRSDNAFQPVNAARIDLKEVGRVLETVFNKTAPTAKVDKKIGNRLMRLIKAGADELGVATLQALEAGVPVEEALHQIGKKTAPAPRGRTLAEQGGVTNTPEFKAWFAGSKAVDKKGQPLVVFHDTHRDSNFTVFGENRRGGKYGEENAVAGWFGTKDYYILANGPEDGVDQATGEGPGAGGAALGHQKRLRVYLSIKNPKVLDILDTYEDPYDPELVAKWKKQGYDGVRSRDGAVWVAFYPEQIKSATDNRGTFDASSPSFLMQEGAGYVDPVDTEEFRAWFGASTVVDKDGDPIQLFHGTSKTFDTFSGNWIYLSDSAKFASKFAVSDKPFAFTAAEAVPVQTAMPEGKETVDGWLSPLPGIAVTQIARGVYSITHIESGLAITKHRFDSVDDGMKFTEFLVDELGDTFTKTTAELKALSPAANKRIGNALVKAWDKYLVADLDFGYKPSSRYGVGSQVLPLYARIEKPLDLRSLPARRVSTARLVKVLKEAGLDVEMKDFPFEGRDLYQILYVPEIQAMLREKATAAGFDGIVFKDFFDEQTKGNSYIVFDGSQVKSATGNTGEFSRSSMSILEQGDSTGAPWYIPDTPAQFVAMGSKGKLHQATGRVVPGEELAQSPFEIGVLNGYAMEDIAHFYLVRRGIFPDATGKKLPKMSPGVRAAQIRSAMNAFIDDAAYASPEIQAMAEGRIPLGKNADSAAASRTLSRKTAQDKWLAEAVAGGMVDAFGNPVHPDTVEMSELMPFVNTFVPGSNRARPEAADEFKAAIRKVDELAKKTTDRKRKAHLRSISSTLARQLADFEARLKAENKPNFVWGEARGRHTVFQVKGLPGASLWVGTVPDDIAPFRAMGGALEWAPTDDEGNGPEPGTGFATSLYITALQHAQMSGAGWASDSIRSPAAQRMYERLIELGVPFERPDDRLPFFRISAKELAKVDWREVEATRKKKYPGTTVLEQPAWQGGPTRGIRQMSTDFIGTGQGAASYGWGLYFAQNLEVAKQYYEELRDRGHPEVSKDGKVLSWDEVLAAFYKVGEVIPHPNGIGLARVLKFHSAEENAKRGIYVTGATVELQLLDRDNKPDPYSRPWETRADSVQARHLAAFLKERGYEVKQGQIYKVEVPESHQLLSWDLPMAEQPVEIQDAVAQALHDAGMTPDEGFGSMLGEDVYRSLADELFADATKGDEVSNREDRGYSYELASKALKKAGIPGLRYYDQGSRRAAYRWVMREDTEEGPRFVVGDKYFDTEAEALAYARENVTHNFVIWDDTAIAVMGTMFQAAYHGTPHAELRGGKFSVDFILSGEGTINEGWGLYFTQRREIAEWYRSNLSGKQNQFDAYYDGKPLKTPVFFGEWGEHFFTALIEDGLPAKKAISQEIARIKGDVQDAKKNPENFASGDIVKNGPLAVEWLKSLDPKKLKVAEPWDQGRVYKVELPEMELLLDRHEPLSKQPPKVLAALKKANLIPVWKAEKKKVVPSVGLVDGMFATRKNKGKWFVEFPTKTGFDIKYYGTKEEAQAASEKWAAKAKKVEYTVSAYIAGRQISTWEYKNMAGAEKAAAEGNANVLDMDGREFYQQLSVAMLPESDRELGDRFNPKGASLALKAAGIPGLRYMTGETRNGRLLYKGKSLDLSAQELGITEEERRSLHAVEETSMLYADEGGRNDLVNILDIHKDGVHDGGWNADDLDVDTHIENVERLEKDLSYVEPEYNFVIWDDRAIALIEQYAQDPGRGGTQEQDTKVEKSPGPRGWLETAKVAGKRIANIFLTEKADFSTFLHESGHAFWELKADLAERPDAPAQVKADFQAALKWMGVKDRAELDQRSADANAIRALADAQDRPLTAEEKAEILRLVEPFEKWARGFEAYLMEGKAPSLSLAGAFAQFKLWLKEVYKTVRGLRVELDDEIRGVFDRMLATDAEIEKAAKQIGITGPAVDEAKSRAEVAALKEVARVHDAAWKKELAKETEEAEKAYEELPERRAWLFLRKGEGTPELKALGEVKLDYAAVASILGSEVADRLFRGVTQKFNAAKGEGGIHPDALAAMLKAKDGASLLKAMVDLPSKSKWAKARADEAMKAKHPGILEERARLDALVQKALHDEPAIVESLHKEWAEDQKAAGDEKVPSVEAARAAARVLIGRQLVQGVDPRKYQKAERTWALKRAALKAKADEAKAAVTRAEAAVKKAEEALSETKAKKGEDPADIQERAKALQERLDKAQESLGKAQEKHRELAQEVADASRKRLLNFYLWKESDQAAREHDSTRELASQMLSQKGQERLGTAFPALRDVTLRLLEATGFVKGIPEEAKQAGFKELQDAFDSLEPDDGEAALEFDLPTLQGLLATPKAFDDLTVAQAAELRAALFQIRAASREKNTILIDGQRKSLKETVGVIGVESSRLPPLTKPYRDRMLQVLKQTRLWEAVAGWQAMKRDPLTTWFDDEWLGPTMRRAVRDRYYTQRGVEDELLRTAGKAILDAWEKMPTAMRERMGEVVDASMLPMTTGREGQVSRAWMYQVLANLGNEQNTQRLLEGRGWTMEQVRELFIKNKLTREEAEFIQGIWDFNDKYLWPRIAEVYTRVKGSRPKKVEARPFQLILAGEGGREVVDLRGGYYPLFADPADSDVGQRQDKEMSVNEASYEQFRASLLQGFTKGRVTNAKYVVRLDDFGVYPAHVARTIRYIAWEEYVRDVNRLLNGLKKDVIIARLGKPAWDQMQAWLKVIATGNPDSVAAVDQALGAVFGPLVNRTVKAAMLLNLKNALADLATPLFTFFGNKGDRIKGRLLLASLLEGTAGLVAPGSTGRGFWAMRQQAVERFSELQMRRDKTGRKVRKAFDRITAHSKRWRPGAALGVNIEPGRLMDWTEDHGYAFQETAATWGETVVAHAAYLSAGGDFSKPVDTNDAVELEARRKANDAVQKAFPSDRAAERSRAMRSKGLMGAFTLMQGFFNRVENMVVRAMHPAMVEFAQAEGWVEKGKVAGVHTVTTGIQVAGIFAVLQLLGGILEGRGPEPEESVPEWVMRKLATFPLILDPVLSQVAPFVEAEVANDAVAGKLKFSASERSAPAVSTALRLFSRLGDIGDSSKPDEKRFWAAYEVIMLAVGGPVSQVKRTGRAITSGDPTLETLIYGPPPRGGAAGNLFQPFGE